MFTLSSIDVDRSRSHSKTGDCTNHQVSKKEIRIADTNTSTAGNKLRPMYFSDAALCELREEKASVSPKYLELMQAYSTRAFENPRAQEFAVHGFMRRLGTMVQCIENVFEIVPPDRTDSPSREELIDCAINIQAFVLNVFGCVDNLAWIWTQERCLTQENGSPIPRNWVGLRKKNSFLRGTFSPEFQRYLNKIDRWLGNLENFRDALAHRIPLYIPPYRVLNSKMDLFQELELRKGKAYKQLDFGEYDRLSAEQDALGDFMPVMTHSFGEDAKVVVFHSQMLADFNTVHQIGCRILDELDHWPA